MLERGRTFPFTTPLLLIEKLKSLKFDEFEIHHLEWIVNEITLKKLEFIYPRFNTLIKIEPSQIQYSKGVKVITWGKCKKDKKRLQQ